MPERGSYRSTLPVVWATFEIFSVRSKWFPVELVDHGRDLVVSLWSGDDAIMKGVATLRPTRKNPLVNFSPQFLKIMMSSSLQIIFQRAKLLTRSITHFYWCILWTFWRKTPREDYQVCLVLAWQCPGSPATCKKMAYLGFQFLDHPPYSPDLAPTDYHLFRGLKKQLKSCHFSSYAEVIAAVETWLDGQYSDFFSACKG